MMYTVYLIDDVSGDIYKRFQGDEFDCLVYTKQHEYEIPKECHYEIEANG